MLGLSSVVSSRRAGAGYSGTRLIASTKRSLVRAGRGMVASSQVLASQAGLSILKRGGNAVDAAVAMAAVLNVTEPMATGVGGDVFALVYWAKTGEVKALNASGRAPHALTRDHFARKRLTHIPPAGMESITVPGAFDGWMALSNRYGTMTLNDLLAPALELAESGFPVAEKAAEDWRVGAARLQQSAEGVAQYLINRRPPHAGERFRQQNLTKTFHILARGGREAFYTGDIARVMADYFQQHGGFITLQDLAEHRSEWVEPISTTYRGYTVLEAPPNGQGLTVLAALNILEGFDLSALQTQPDAYYHVQVEAIKLAFADRNRYIADPAFTTVPVKQLLSKDYAARRRALIQLDRAMPAPQPGEVVTGNDTTYLTVVDKDRNAVSFINSVFELFGSGIVAGDTGVLMQDRAEGFSLDPNSPNRLEPGKRPLHTIIPALVFKDGRLFMSFGVMGGDMQPQAQVQVLCNIMDRGMDVQRAIDAPRFRYQESAGVLLEPGTSPIVMQGLSTRGHRTTVPNNPYSKRATFGGAQAIMVDPMSGDLLGASDARKDGAALGY